MRPFIPSLKGAAITGLMQDLTKHWGEATENLWSDATGVYNPNRHMAVVTVRWLLMGLDVWMNGT